MSIEDRQWIVDGHNDLVQELVWRRNEDAPFARWWLPKLRSGGVGLQICPLYVWWDDIGDRALRSGMEQIAALLRAEAENPDVLLVRCQSDLDAVEAGDRFGLLIAIEGAEVIGNDPGLLEVYINLGVRMVSLPHFQRNAFADGNGEREDGGLSILGRKLVEQLDRRGVIVDLAHASAHLRRRDGCDHRRCGGQPLGVPRTV